MATANDLRIIDTNLIVRHLTQDHEQHSRVAGELLDRCDRGALRVVLLPVVLAECVFVLESFYRRSRVEIAEALTRLIACPGINLEDREMHRDALGRYARSRMHFVDCVIAATAAVKQWPVATLDAGFRKFPDVRVHV